MIYYSFHFLRSEHLEVCILGHSNLAPFCISTGSLDQFNLLFTFLSCLVCTILVFYLHFVQLTNLQLQFHRRPFWKKEIAERLEESRSIWISEFWFLTRKVFRMVVFEIYGDSNISRSWKAVASESERLKGSILRPATTLVLLKDTLRTVSQTTRFIIVSALTNPVSRIAFSDDELSFRTELGSLYDDFLVNLISAS